MEQIDFHFNVPVRTRYACLLMKKVTAMGLSVGVWSTDKQLLDRVYDELWSFDDLTCITHAWVGAEYAGDAAVLFSAQLETLPVRDVLVLLDEQVPENWSEQLAPFSRVVDIVSTNADELVSARARYRVYHAAGLRIKAYDRAR